MYPLALILVCLLAAAPVAASALSSRIDALVEPYVSLGDFSGTILVEDGGEIVHRRSYGMADHETGTANTPEHAYRIGSISKQFTAVAILLLETDGIVRVSDPVARYLPRFPRGDEITLHHLLAHRAGVVDIFALPGYSAIRQEPIDLEGLVARIAAEPLEFDPGSDYAYSNSGYAVLARIVELASGWSYDEFLQKRIFTPLNMASSGSSRDARVVPGLARGYDPTGATGFRTPPFVNPVFYVGSGSVYATVDDLNRWQRALEAGDILPDSSLARMRTDHGNAYGYGVSVYSRYDGPVVEHDGRMPGYAGDLARYVDRGATVVILGNVQSTARDRLRDDIAALLHGEPVAERSLRATRPAPSTVDLDTVEGRYGFGPSFTVDVLREDDHLLLRANGGEWSEFSPSGEATFFSRMLYAEVSFTDPVDGLAQTLVYAPEGGRFEGTRLP